MDKLRILFVEDNLLDAELTARELRESGFDMKWQRVDTQADFMNRLTQDPPDIIISDDAMPQFSSGEALQCLRESGLTIPFIVVSHAIGEEEAVQLMRNGAADYTEIVVSPEDDIELRRTRITNGSRISRTIEITSYAEEIGRASCRERV